MVLFSSGPFPSILKYRDHWWDLQKSGKQEFFRPMLKSAASMYESSGSQFFRTTNVIQSGRDAFDKSRFDMTFLTFLGVMVILCSFRWVLEGKTGKEIPESSRLEFFQKF